ncbi:MAG: helix-turn-helix transcriptional regulator [Actinobacteria bacterium]|nr:helix-turn-helix transcriptional regulator [Actinomycetota bacterium]
MGDKLAVATISQILTLNLVRMRAARSQSQRSLAETMRLVGSHNWTDVTVSNVERGERSVSVAELGTLAFILGASPAELLAPPPPPFEGLASIGDVALGAASVAVIPKHLYAAWLEGFGSMAFDAGKVTYDTDLAHEFFKRQGLFIGHPKQP